jgi:EpsI family protein
MVAQSLVVWFNSQRSGERQPHSPKVCLPGSGWIPISSDVITVSTMAASITVNRYVVTNHGSRSVVLYWYQTPRRVTANEWMAKLWLVIDSARDRRSDVALVRIVVPIGDSQDAAMLAAADFAQAAYPLLREILPH